MPKDNFFKRIFSGLAIFFRNVFTKARAIAEKVIPVGIEAVEIIKKFVDSPATPLLTALIPGGVDDMIAIKLREILPDILLKLRIAEECAKKTSNDEIIQCAIEALKKYHPTAQKAYYLTIASMISEALADGKLSWSEVVMITQYTYDNKYKKP